MAKYKPIEVLMETFLKVIIGLSSAMIVNLAINVDIVFGFIEKAELRYLIGFISGWSERFFPNLMDKLEKSFNETK